jgi:hypothetical protein
MMPTPADAYTAVIAAVLSARPPKVGSPEAAMQRVTGDSLSTDLQTRVFEALQDRWRQVTSGKDIEGRLRLAFDLYDRPTITALFASAEKTVGVTNDRAMTAALIRLRQNDEAEVIGVLAAHADTAIASWMSAVEQHRSPIEKSKELRGVVQRLNRGLLLEFANRAAAGAVSASARSASELKRIADEQVRPIVTDHRHLLVEAALAGVVTWHVPEMDEDHVAALLSAGSGLTGGIGSVVTTVASLPGVFGAGAATALSFTGIGILVVGMGLGVAAYYDSLQDQAMADARSRLDAAIKKETIRAFSELADGITLVQDALAIVCAAEAIKARIELGGPARDELRRFIWDQMFPAITPPTLVAATAFVTATMEARLNPQITGS